MIAGGGNIGLRLAESIEQHYQVKVIERDADRCKVLSESLDRAIVLNGEASQRELLIEENIADTDVFLALTNDDEANISAEARKRRSNLRRQ